MNALFLAELLRLRTVRSPALFGVGGLAILLALAVVPILAAADHAPSAGELDTGLRSVQVMAVLLAAAFAASTVASDFTRGATTLTYLAEPRRGRVLAARTALYAALGALFGALAAACTAAATHIVVDREGLDAPITSLDVVWLIAGAACAGALVSAVAALIGTAARNATIASGAIVLWNLGESMLHAAGVDSYLPFGLVRTLLGLEQDLAPVPAFGLLVAYAALLAVAVHRWGLPRDLT